jgi:hypothetical protein
MEGGAMVAGFIPAQMSNWRIFIGIHFHSARQRRSCHTQKKNFRKLSSLNMDDSSEDQDCSLKDILMAVKSQADDNTKLRQEISNLRQEMYGVSLSVSSQVKKLKTDSQYAWKYEGNKVQYLLNSEFIEELALAVWAIDNLKFEHVRETISELVEKVKRRNKLIKIADTSEEGWETVRQYESSPVASDSDDESKINKAENRALKTQI